MTISARDLPLPTMIETEGMLRELCGGPGSRVVTVFAVRSKCPCVHLGFRVACAAFSRCPQIDFLVMARPTFNNPVGLPKRVDFIVVKIRHTILPVVTIQASWAVLTHVPGHV